MRTENSQVLVPVHGTTPLVPLEPGVLVPLGGGVYRTPPSGATRVYQVPVEPGTGYGGTSYALGGDRDGEQ